MAARGRLDKVMKTAIIHYWLVGMRGGEKVLQTLCDVFPAAEIFTHVYRPSAVSAALNSRTIRTTFINRLPFAATQYQKYLPLMPLALEQLDLRDYDLVISSESGPAKGVITRPDALHVCYCHTPMRYAWSMYHDYLAEANPFVRSVMPWVMHRLRQWDFQAAARVDAFAANSRYVARQIEKYYRRDAEVIYPPVETDRFAPSDEVEDFYLCVGQLVRYKRVDLAIAAVNALGRRLVVIGDGKDAAYLRQMAGPTVTFLGRQDETVIGRHYATCRALIFPGKEDFGIVPVEAMASGRPVLAFGAGGALETVVEGTTGLFFQEQTLASLIATILEFEARAHEFSSSRLVEHAKRFAPSVFRQHIVDFVHRSAAAQAGGSTDKTITPTRASSVDLALSKLSNGQRLRA
jgi:glycosyltransferase involved in cell wall biosynthesis